MQTPKLIEATYLKPSLSYRELLRQTQSLKVYDAKISPGKIVVFTIRELI